MDEQKLEMEVKFYLNDPSGYEKRLRSIGASLKQPRTHELNYRFDNPDLSLTRAHRVLRLRQDQNVIITYKGPAQSNQPVSIRQEIELEVGDLTTARSFLEALGYRVSVQYEKYRTTYDLNGLEITLDEMPFGVFTELEGDNPAHIQTVAASLSLLWSTRITDSYIMLFDHIRQSRNLPLQNLTFDEFTGVAISPDDLGVKPADSPVYL